VVSLEEYNFFSNSAEYVYVEKREPATTLRHLIWRMYSFQRLTPFSQKKNVQDAPASNNEWYPREIQVFRQLIWIGLYGAKWAFIHSENFNLQELSFQNLTQVSHRKKVLGVPVSNSDGFLLRDTCVPSTSWIGWFATKWTFLQLENYGLQEAFLSKLAQFSEGDNARDAAASIIDHFLWRNTCASSLQLNRTIWSKKCLSPPWIT
jgi:hypothetical protein